MLHLKRSLPVQQQQQLRAFTLAHVRGNYRLLLLLVVLPQLCLQCHHVLPALTRLPVHLARLALAQTLGLAQMRFRSPPQDPSPSPKTRCFFMRC